MNALTEVKDMQETVGILMKEPHYAKLRREGIIAILSTAKALNIDPLRALNGALYYVNGKVELSASMMSSLIRQKGHSITKDKKSDNTICILHGKRIDSGDTWSASFSIDDAKKAGLINSRSPHSPWVKYTEDMLYARALSRLARQLFPDVIAGCYVEGEIPRNETSIDVKPIEEPMEKPVDRRITAEEYLGLLNKLQRNAKYKQEILEFFAKNNKQLSDITLSAHDRIINKLESMEPEDEVSESGENKDEDNVRADSESAETA